VTVNQIMETKVIVVNKNATLRDAAEKLSVGGFHALPVVDRKRHLVGMVTSSDLIGVLVSRLDN
jgi:CBS domain-containing protein